MQDGLSCGPFLFLRKRNGPHPKEKSWARASGRVLLFPAPRNTVIAGMPSSPGVTPCRLERLSGRDSTPRGRLGGALDSGVPALLRRRARPGRAPRRGAESVRESITHYRRRRAGRAARFFTSFPGAGSRRVLPQVLRPGLFLWQPETVSVWARPKRNGFGRLDGVGAVFYICLSKDVGTAVPSPRCIVAYFFFFFFFKEALEDLAALLLLLGQLAHSSAEGGEGLLLLVGSGWWAPGWRR